MFKAGVVRIEFATECGLRREDDLADFDAERLFGRSQLVINDLTGSLV